MTWWLWLFAASLVISHLCRNRLKARRVSGNQSAYQQRRYEQDRPYPECFDDNEMEDDL